MCFSVICCLKKKAKNKKKNRQAMNESLEDEEENKVSFIYGHSVMGHGKKKKECQDTFCIMENFDTEITYMAVYDGHGSLGREASQLANDSIKDLLKKNSKRLIKMRDHRQIYKFIRSGFIDIQKKYKTKIWDFTLSGTCAICVLVIRDYMYIANLGDSRAVVGHVNKKGEKGDDEKEEEPEIYALEVSIDHKPFRDCERDRIQKSGGKIERSLIDDREVGPLRVWKPDEDLPGIAVTRTFGDLVAHKIGVISDPEMGCKQILPEDKFIIIGSDGVWDVMSSAESVGFLLRCPDIGGFEESAKRLVEECKDRWDYLNENKKKQAQQMLERSETDTKKIHEKLASLEKSIVRDDISVCVYDLTNQNEG